MEEAARFWAKVDAEDCWVWTAAKKFDGYGLFRRSDQRQVFAHRWAYEHLVRPIPDDLTVDHLCRVRACVNPDHMELVEMSVNVLRGYGPSAMNARRTHCQKGHELVQAKTQRICRTCQTEYSNAWKAVQRRAAGVPIGKGAKWKAKTHCPKGHPYDETNTVISKEGYRRCRECLYAASRESKRRKREAAKGTP
jgi:hypothetical protein